MDGDLRVWWIPQLPAPTLTIAVPNLEIAAVLLDTLGEYDLFQLENNIKPDYSNAGGLEIYRNGEWEEWEDEHGDDIDAAVLSQLTGSAVGTGSRSGRPYTENQ